MPLFNPNNPIREYKRENATVGCGCVLVVAAILAAAAVISVIFNAVGRLFGWS